MRGRCLPRAAYGAGMPQRRRRLPAVWRAGMGGGRSGGDGEEGGGRMQCREEGCRGRWPRLSERAGGSQRWEGPAALGARGRSLAGTPSECVPTEKYHVKQSAESRL